jgi:hypothetical protein
MNLEYTNGKEIVRANFTEFTAFLTSRKVERLETNPDRMCFIADGRKLLLRIAGSPQREFLVRASFIDKLLKWHHLSRWQMRNASNETAVSFFNDLLLAINGEVVRVYVEDGEAKTITSTRYTEFFDDEVAAACTDLLNVTVSRTDKVLRIDSEIKDKFQPRAGDDCGFGFTIFNSETGFHALQVSHYIIRYVCSNGMIVKIPMMNNRLPSRVHYRLTTNNLQEFLNEQIFNIETTRGGIESQVEQSVLRPPSSVLRSRVAALLKTINVNAKTIRKEIDSAATEWDLANIVTAYARHQNVDIRLQLERSAGLLLFGELSLP